MLKSFASGASLSLLFLFSLPSQASTIACESALNPSSSVFLVPKLSKLPKIKDFGSVQDFNNALKKYYDQFKIDSKTASTWLRNQNRQNTERLFFSLMHLVPQALKDFSLAVKSKQSFEDLHQEGSVLLWKQIELMLKNPEDTSANEKTWSTKVRNISSVLELALFKYYQSKLEPTSYESQVNPEIQPNTYKLERALILDPTMTLNDAQALAKELQLSPHNTEKLFFEIRRGLERLEDIDGFLAEFTFDTKLDSIKLKKQLDHHFNVLFPNEARVIRLIYFEGKSIQEVLSEFKKESTRSIYKEIITEWRDDALFKLRRALFSNLRKDNKFEDWGLDLSEARPLYAHFRQSQDSKISTLRNQFKEKDMGPHFTLLLDLFGSDFIKIFGDWRVIE